MDAAANKPGKWDKDRIVAALLDRQARGLGLNERSIRETDGPLNKAIWAYFRWHDAALRAAGIDPDSVRLRGRPWDKGRVVAALRERRDKGLELSSRAVNTTDPGLGHGIRKNFASYDAALTAAGITPESVRRRVPWDKPRIMEALRERRARGQPMNLGAIERSDLRLCRAMRSHFGTHDAALSAAGIELPQRAEQRPLDKAAVVAALRERASKGLALNVRGVREASSALGSAIRRCFSSHDEALRAAGIDPESARRHRWWGKPSVLAALRERLAEGLEMNERSISRSDPRLAVAARNHFGSLDAALLEIGVDPASVRKRQIRDPDRIIASLRGLARDGALPWPLGKSGGQALVRIAWQYFGSIKAAAQAAGLRYERPGGGEIGHWTEELVLQTLRDLHQGGHDLRYRHMKEGSQPLFFAAKELFGSYVNAVRQAGIDYWEMSQAHLARDRAAAVSRAPSESDG